MPKLTTSDLTNLQNESSAVSTINSNFAAVETALENTLSRDGTSPNTMSANLDMNSNRILNLPAAVDDTEPVRLGDVEVLIASIGTGPQGPAGTNGTNGDDGATILVQASAPATTYPENSLWIDSDSTDLDLYKLISSTWTDTTVNLKGTAGTNGSNGLDGDQIYVQASAPSTSGVSEGSIWIDSDSVDNDLFVLTGGSWIDSGVNLKGASGAGTGDVVGPASSIDSEIALFNSTTGKLIKRASTTGILKGTSGVLSAATAGTDYLAPPSGTAILKANSGGALANATAGTDYVAPGGALGTPSSGTLTNVSGLPISGLVASTSTAIGVGSVELGHATDTTLARVSAGVMSVEGNTVAMLATAQTFTKPQKLSTTALTHNTAWDGANANHLTATVSGSSFTVANPSAQTADVYYHLFVTYSTSHSLAWGTNFKGVSSVTPTATSGAYDHFVFRSNGTNLMLVGYSLNIGA